MLRTDRPADTFLLETATVNRENLPSALATVQGCWKSSSLLWLHTNGFPVLPGLVLSGWVPASEEAVARFCRERNLSELLVRIEKPGQRWTRRRGGYTILSSRVRPLVEDLTAEGMLTILLEPASPNMDLYSLTSVCDLHTGKVDVEVVGHGFDASDILRGDITPHERFELSFDNGTTISRHTRQLAIKRTYVIERQRYQESVRRRLMKIGARLRNPSFPDELMGLGASTSCHQELAEEATLYLRGSGQTALLDHLNEYEPIPAGLMDIVLGHLMRLFQRVKRSNPPWRVLSVASSFVSQDRFVFWDFFTPGNPDAMVLSQL